MGIFSEELRIMDQNTVKYMIEEMRKKIEEKDCQLEEIDRQIEEMDRQIEKRIVS